MKAAAYSMFCIMWKQPTPNVIMKPMSNLCWVCQKNSMAIMRAANTPEAEKSQVIKDIKHKTKVIHTLGSQGRGKSVPSHTGDHTTPVPLRLLKRS